jgi:tryptophan synthase alpha chain
MNKINALFQNKPKNILSIYFTAGFPELNDTVKIIKELQENGIDMIEVGIPFSDPMADGPVIQESSTIALRNGMNLKTLFSQLQSVKHEVHIPLIMMGYLNPVMQYGFEKFCCDCQKTGVSGMIIPDLPFSDYLDEYKPVADKYDLKIILLITPETSEERIRLIDAHTDGFIYMVSSAATTGAQKNFDEKKQEYFRRINRMGLRNPRLIGFGISNKETLSIAFENASGAIVGSKFISLLAEEKIPEKAVKKMKKNEGKGERRKNIAVIAGAEALSEVEGAARPHSRQVKDLCSVLARILLNKFSKQEE